MTENDIVSYSFGPFRIETLTQRLFKDGTVVPLTRKRFEILLLLVQNAGRVIKKEEIFDSIWPKQSVEESNLTQHIYLLRRDIEVDPKTPYFILTVPGEGYRFHPEVKTHFASEKLLASYTNPDSTRILTETAPTAPHSEGETENLNAIKSPNTFFAQLYPRRVIIALVLVIVLVTAISLLTIRYRSLIEGTDDTIPSVSPLQTSLGLKSELAFSNDGKLLAYISDDGNSSIPDVYVMTENGGTPIRITNTTSGEYFVTWSPDNQQLAFLRWSPDRPAKYLLVTTPALGGAERELSEVDGGIDWSPDGVSFAVCDSVSDDAPVGIVLLSADGRTRATLSAPDSSDGYDSRPRFSPDGTRVAFLRWAHSASGDLHIVEIANRKTSRITFDNASISDFNWTMDGKGIVFASNRSGNNRLWQIGATGGSPVLLAKVPADVHRFSISPSNPQKLAYTLSLVDTSIDVLPISTAVPSGGVPAQPLCSINSSRGDDSPRWSPNGELIAFCSSRSGFTEIWISRANCTELRQLTNFRQINVGSPRWSPDSRNIVFDQIIDGQAEVMKINLETGGVLQMTDSPSSDKLPSFSSDGQWVYFNSNRSGSSQIWRMRPDGSGYSQVTVNGGFEAVESPDGNTLFYTKNNFLWKKDLRTRVELPVGELNGQTVHRYWDVAPNTIYYVPLSSSTGTTLFALKLPEGQIRPLLTLNGVPHRELPGISFSPAGTSVAASQLRYPFLDILQIENWR